MDISPIELNGTYTQATTQSYPKMVYWGCLAHTVSSSGYVQVGGLPEVRGHAFSYLPQWTAQLVKNFGAELQEMV